MPRLPLLLGFLLGGFGLGAALRLLTLPTHPEKRSTAPNPATLPDPCKPTSSRPNVSKPSPGLSPAGLPGEPSSTPTIDDVLAAEDGERIEKLALWLATATGEETTAMYQRLTAEDDHPNAPLQMELVFQRWIEIDRNAAFHAGRESIGGEWKCYQAWARIDPHAAWNDAKHRNYFAQKNALRSIAETDPGFAAELLKQWNDPMTAGETSLHSDIAGGLARTNPTAAADYMISHRAAPVTALKAWFQNEPEAAQAWALAQTSPLRKTEAIRRLVADWSDSHPERISDLLHQIPEGQAKWAGQATYTASLARTDTAAALAYAATISSPAARTGILQETAYDLCNGNQPEAAFRVLREMDWPRISDSWKTPRIATPDSGGHEPGPTLAAKTLQYLAEDHLADTLAIAANVPAGPLQDQAMASIAEGWPRRQTTELSGWINEQTVPIVREAGARRLVENLLLDAAPDFDAAARWAATVPVTGKLEQTPLHTVFERWKISDPQAAQTALTELDLPASVREVLAKPPAP